MDCGRSVFLAIHLHIGILLNDVIGGQNVESCRLLGEYVADGISSDVEDTKVYTTRRLWVDAVKGAKYLSIHSATH